MRRVVVTGIGIVSCLGNNKEEVLDSLQQVRSGIKHNVDAGQRLGDRVKVAYVANFELKLAFKIVEHHIFSY